MDDGNATHQRIISLPDTGGARYSVVVRVGVTKKKGRYVPAVVPGDSPAWTWRRYGSTAKG